MKKLFTKTLAVFTAVLMLCLTLPFFTACGGRNDPHSSTGKETAGSKATQKPKPTKAPKHDPNEAVVFSDPQFEERFREAYDYSEHEIVTYGKLLEITELRLTNINSLKDIAMFTNLTALDLSGSILENRIFDISPLSGLTKLTNLNLRTNQISDISALSGLTKLTNLNLWDNQISDISALSGLTELRELNLKGNEIFDIKPLSGLKNLTKLDLSFNDNIFYLDSVSKLKNLTVLNLELALDPKADLSPLSKLTGLTELNLRENKISDISALSGLTKLTSLYLEDNNFTASTDVSPLFNLTPLETLSIKLGNELTQSQIDAIQSHLPNCAVN